MRVVTAAGVLVLSAAPALAGYLVELDAGDRMTVDSYREEGDRIHLLRGGVDLNVPRSRIRSLQGVSGPADRVEPSPARRQSVPAPRLGSPAPASRPGRPGSST